MFDGASNYNAFSTRAFGPFSQTFDLALRKAPGKAFNFVVRVSAGASYSYLLGTAEVLATLTFEDLPPGARVVSCHGYDSQLPHVCGPLSTNSVYSNSPVATVAGDFDGDHVVDLAIANYRMATLDIRWSRFTYQSQVPVGAGPRGLACADFDGDGREDLAVSSQLENAAAVLLGPANRAAGFQVGWSYTIAGPWGAVARDFDEDGIMDLAIAGHDGISVFRGRGTRVGGLFGSPTVYPWAEPHALVSADVNADGILDLIATSPGGGVSIHLGGGADGVGDGTFDPGFQVPVPATGVEDVAAGDFNCDGIVDLATSVGGGFVVLIGQSSGVVGGAAFAATFYADGNTSHPGIAASDYDGDGVTDIAVTDSDGGWLSLYRGLGNGAFYRHGRYWAGAIPAGILVADMNADGVSDAVVAGRGSNNVVILYSNCSAPSRRFAINVSTRGSGRVTRDPEQGSYPKCSRVLLKAVPDRGYRFTGWSGDAAGTANPLAVIVDRDKSVTATFALEVGFRLEPHQLRKGPGGTGRWVTGFLRPPPPFKAEQFDQASVRLNGVIPVDTAGPGGATHGGGGHGRELMVKFGRQPLVAGLPVGVRTLVTATGSIGGDPFIGDDSVEVVAVEGGLPALDDDVPGDLLPQEVELSLIGAHPVVGGAAIAFALPSAVDVRLELFDVQGRRFVVLAQGPRRAGRHTVSWDAADDGGRHVPAGIYMVRLEAAEITLTRRLVLIW